MRDDMEIVEGRMIRYCGKGETVIIPSAVIEIGDSAFEGEPQHPTC